MKLLVILIGIFIVASTAYSQTLDAANKLKLAQAFEQAGEFDRAEQMYQELLASDSSNYVYFDGLRRSYTMQKNYSAAIQLSLQRLQHFHDDPNVMVELGSLYYSNGEEARADSMWNAVIALTPKNLGMYRLVASVQSQDRLFDKTIATYLRARKELNDPSLFVNELASLYALMMNYSDATKEYLKLLEQNDSQLGYVESRMSFYTSKEAGLSEAARITEAAVAKDKNNIGLLRLLVWLYMEGKRYDDAFKIAEQLEGMISSGGTELFGFAQRVFHDKAYAVAAKAYRAAIDQSQRDFQHSSLPYVPQAKFGYARCIEELSAGSDSAARAASEEIKSSSTIPLESQPTYEGAAALYMKLAAEYPRTEIAAQSLYRVGYIRYHSFFDLDGALRLFDSVLAFIPANSMAAAIQATKGDIYIAMGNLELAAKMFSAVMSAQNATDAQKTQAQFRLAEIQYFKGDFSRSLDDLKPLTANLGTDESNDALGLQYFISENQTAYPDALRKYANAEFLVRQKKLNEALADLDDIIELYSAAPLADDALVRKAEILTTLTKEDSALTAYQKLLADYPNSILRDKVQFKIAELYQNIFHNKEKAIQAYEQLLASYPQSLYVNEARKRIRMLRGDAL
jgi:tetratricopeptide (TPR) repeat protein